MKRKPYINKKLHELLYQALESERGGIKISQAALSCAQNGELKGEWEEYLEQTRAHELVLLKLFEELGLNPDAVTTGQEVVAHLEGSLVTAMEKAKAQSSAAAAQLVAGECVVLAEAKDHLNWELIWHLAEHATTALRAAFEAVKEEEGHHHYHTHGFTGELWRESHGLPAILRLTEGMKKVDAISAAKVENQHDGMLKSKHRRMPPGGI